MEGFLSYHIYEDEGDFLSIPFSITIEAFVEDSDTEIVVGEMTGSLINSWGVPQNKWDLITNLDYHSNAAMDFGAFYYDLLDGKFDDKCEYIREHVECSRVIWIDHLEIHDKYRHKGIGTSALKKLKDHCSNFWGLNCIFLFPYPLGERNDFKLAHSKLVKFYERVGFEKIDVKFEEHDTPLYCCFT